MALLQARVYLQKREIKCLEKQVVALKKCMAQAILAGTAANERKEILSEYDEKNGDHDQ